jgi:hypothetical protein
MKRLLLPLFLGAAYKGKSSGLTTGGAVNCLTGKSGGGQLAGNRLPDVWRNGAQHDWTKHMAVYQTTTDGSAKISLGWKERKFHVECAGKVFDAQLTDDGKYTFTNR